MPDSAPQQLLHLVIGGEMLDLEHNTFKNLDDVEIVGLYPNYASAHVAWRAKAQSTVDNAQMRYFIVHLHRLLDPNPEPARLKNCFAIRCEAAGFSVPSGSWRPNICVWSGGPTSSRSIRPMSMTGSSRRCRRSSPSGTASISLRPSSGIRSPTGPRS